MKRGGMLIAGTVAAGLWLAPGAIAKTFEVTTTGDPVPNGCAQGACTLREAVIAANNRSGEDEVSLKARKTYELALGGVDEDNGLTGDLDSTGRLAMTVRGQGRRPAIDGADLDRILHLFAPARVVGIVFRNGNMSGASETGDGGGIFAGGSLTLVRSVVRGNAASDNGEGISADDGASITLIRSAVIKNLGQGVRQEGAGGIALRRSAVSANDQLGIQESDSGGVTAVRSRVVENGATGISESGDGSVVAPRTKVVGNASVGIQEFEAGSLNLNRARVNGNGSAGAQEFGDGGLSAARARVNGNQSSGILEFDPGSLNLNRARVNGNGSSGALEFNEGGLSAARGRIKDNESSGILEFNAGSLNLNRARVIGNDSTGALEFNEGGVSAARARINGNAAEGVLEFDAGSLSLKRARVNGNDSDGAFEFAEGDLVMKRTQVGSNGGTGAQDSGAGSLRVFGSTVAGNHEGGLATFGGDRGRIDRTTVRNNTNAASGAGIFDGSDNGLLITNSTISDNTSLDDSGGGIWTGTPVTVINSTLSGNRAALSGGGIRADGPSADIRLNAVTIVRNVANYDDTSTNTAGGGISANNSATFTGTRNTLIALNRADFGASFPDCSANLDSGGHNLIGDDEGCSGLVGSDLVRARPRVGRLRDNGGPTKTVALKKGSPAIGRAGRDAPNRDQRGVRRDRNPDIGAYER